MTETREVLSIVMANPSRSSIAIGAIRVKTVSTMEELAKLDLPPITWETLDWVVGAPASKSPDQEPVQGVFAVRGSYIAVVMPPIVEGRGWEATVMVNNNSARLKSFAHCVHAGQHWCEQVMMGNVKWTSNSKQGSWFEAVM